MKQLKTITGARMQEISTEEVNIKEFNINQRIARKAFFEIDIDTKETHQIKALNLDPYEARMFRIKENWEYFYQIPYQKIPGYFLGDNDGTTHYIVAQSGGKKKKQEHYILFIDYGKEIDDVVDVFFEEASHLMRELYGFQLQISAGLEIIKAYEDNIA